MFSNNNISQSLIDAITKVSQDNTKVVEESSDELIQIPGYGKITREQAKRKAADHLKMAADHLMNGHHSASYHHNQMAHAFLSALHNDRETTSIPK